MFARPDQSGDTVTINRKAYLNPVVATGLTVVENPDPQLTIPAAITLTEQEAQSFMDGLWQAGIRPADGTGSTGQLAATQNHLKDLQTITANLLAKVLK
jgi:hypothetical protein